MLANFGKVWPTKPQGYFVTVMKLPLGLDFPPRQPYPSPELQDCSATEETGIHAALTLPSSSCFKSKHQEGGYKLRRPYDMCTS